jgi:hypothetical protein
MMKKTHYITIKPGRLWLLTAFLLEAFSLQQD